MRPVRSMLAMCAGLFALWSATAPGTARAQRTSTLELPKETPEQFARRTRWWREAKFGMFIHWGIYAVPADSSKGLAEWYMSNMQKQVAEYERFAAQFNPVRFNAAEWVSMARNAGMKYMVITSKHHDGFAIFDSKVSDYDIMDATPFKRDILKELAAACTRQGIKLGFYYSIMDWHHPDYLPRRPWEAQVRPATGASFDRYVAYMKAQLKELITQYDPAILWFDGEWENTWTHERAIDLYRYLKALKPSLIINNRIDKGRQGMAGMNVSDQFLGDFGTPEQEIPPSGFSDDRLWETCMTMNDTWGYSRNDHNWKSGEDLTRKLIDIAHKGGNFLLNVGPTELGEFTPETRQILATMGRWMRKYGQAIYGTTQSPFRKLAFHGRCTRKGNTLYLHVFEWPSSGLFLYGLKTPVRSARVPRGETLTITRQAIPGQPVTLLIDRPKRLDPVATVVELRLEGPPIVEEAAVLLRPLPDGSFQLTASQAEIQGQTARLETKGGQENIGFWTHSEDTVHWRIHVPASRSYQVSVEYACAPENAGSTYRIRTDGSGDGVTAVVQSTGGWDVFRTVTLEGQIRIPAGYHTLRVEPQSMPRGAVMNLRRVILTPVP